MYRVYVDDNLVYQPLIDELALTQAVVSQEVNCAGSFVYQMYPNNTYYGQEQKLKSIVKVYSNDNLIFRGRVLNSTMGFYKSRTVTCEGALSFLHDSKQRPYSFSGTPEELLELFIDSHNEQMQGYPEKQFVKGTVTVPDPNDYIVRSDSTYMSTRDSITKKLIDICGGYIRVRYGADETAYLDYLEDFTTINSQKVEFGKNLLNLEEVIKGQDIATCIIPLGAKVESEDDEVELRLTIASVNDGIDYVYDEDAVEKYGRIFKVVEHDDVTLASNLLTKGQADLQGWVNLIVSISLSAVDLSAVDASIDAFEVGSYTKIVSAPHDFDEIFLTRKRTIDLLNPQSSTLELGEERTTLTDKTVSADKNIGQIVETVETVKTDIKINETLNESQISLLRQDLMSSIEQTVASITSLVEENYYDKSDSDALISSVSTLLTQTSNQWEFLFSQYEESLEDLSNSTASEFTNISKYIRFEDGNIILGEAGNEMTLVQENDRISFRQNNVEVMYMTGNMIYITDGKYAHSLVIGDYGFKVESNGSISLGEV